MKNVFTLLILSCFASGSALAQFNKGDKLLGGSLSLNLAQNSGSSLGNHIGLTPQFSTFVSSRTAIGIKGGFGLSHSKNEGLKFERTDFSFSPGLFLTRYRAVKNKFGISFNHELYFSYLKSKTIQNGFKSYSEDLYAGYRFTPGMYYRFTDRLIGTGSLGSAYAQWGKAANGVKTFSAGAAFLQNMELGIAFRVGKK